MADDKKKSRKNVKKKASPRTGKKSENLPSSKNIDVPENISATESNINIPVTEKKHKSSGDARKQVSAASLFPQSEDAKEELRARAALLAKESDHAINVGQFQEYLCFKLGSDERYGISYEFVEEIMATSRIASVPCTPEFLAGAINRRGDLLNVLDLKALFHIDYKSNAEEFFIIVVRVNGWTVGILVDAVEHNDYFDRDQLTQAMSSDGIVNLNYISGIHNGAVAMLDIQAILSDSLLIVNESVA